MKQNVEDIYNRHGVSDKSIKLLIDGEHPSDYLPFVQSYITKELYQKNTADISKWLNMLYEDARFQDMQAVSDYMQIDLAEFYRHALIISDFKFSYTRPHSLFISRALKKEDSVELKQQLIKYFQPMAEDLYSCILGWPSENALHLTREDATIVLSLYAQLVTELLKQNNLDPPPLHVTYFCGPSGILSTLLVIYKNSSDELLKIKHESMPILALTHMNETDYPIVYNIGRELYGDKFDQIYNVGKSLDLLGNPEYWRAHDVCIEHTELPDFLSGIEA